MRIRNAEVYNSGRKCFIRADLDIENGKFSEILYTGKGGGESDKLIIPGFIDIHSHGARGIDIMGADCGALIEMSGYYAGNGVTSLFASTSSAEHEDIMRTIGEVKKARDSGLAKINFAGIHLEGPYINENRAGAHDRKFIKPPDLNELDEIISGSLGEGLKLHITIAPEINGALDFIYHAVKKGATISLGHTEASGEIIKKAIELGAKSLTHLFNAMSPLHHREPGVSGSALVNDDIYAEIICDGIHLHPDIVKLAYRAKGIDKIIIVSDSMSAAGIPEGEYNSGESRGVRVKDGRAFIKNPDGSETIAGSTSDLYAELNNFIDFTGCKLQNALLTVTRNPAECAGIYNGKGSVETGKDADFIILDKNRFIKDGKALIKEVYVNGEAAQI
ncbi:MAG: N-acetylglucosamine-6-phosphate deacetylase [Oscillospiraceae bacterium]|nr:N-acetylglucosamine-6-phosphate deacetylase [Oscillospiraceae bacterium]